MLVRFVLHLGGSKFVALFNKAAELCMDVEVRGELRNLADRMQESYNKAVDEARFLK